VKEAFVRSLRASYEAGKKFAIPSFLPSFLPSFNLLKNMEKYESEVFY
jgi:hypothetical protein